MRKPTAVSASAPGKIIISGEHFVVHGSSAVAAAINRRIRISVSASSKHTVELISQGKRSSMSSSDVFFAAVRAVLKSILQEFNVPRTDLRVEIFSEIPRGSGLGSSAAVSVASAAATLKFIEREVDPDTICRFALEGEKAVHGNPSGIDVHASLLGGLVLFNRKNGARRVPVDRPIRFVVGFTGDSRRTSDLIRKVAQRKKRFPGTFEHLSDAATFVSMEIVEAISSRDLQHLGALLDVSQAVLTWIGASTSRIDKLVEMSLEADALGAKVTGAGGGGSIILLPKPGRDRDLARRVSDGFETCFTSEVPEDGLRWEPSPPV